MRHTVRKRPHPAHATTLQHFLLLLEVCIPFFAVYAQSHFLLIPIQLSCPTNKPISRLPQQNDLEAGRVTPEIVHVRHKPGGMNAVAELKSPALAVLNTFSIYYLFTQSGGWHALG
jgi:hypothetical protein